VKTNAARTALALFALPLIAGAAHAREDLLPPGVTLHLPRTPGLSSEWLIPPSTSARVNARLYFTVGRGREAWFVKDRRAIYVPQSDALFKSDRPFEQLAWTSSGRKLVRSGAFLGKFLAESKPPGRGLIEVRFKPLIKVPLESWRIAPTERDDVYIEGYNPRRRLRQIARFGLDAGQGIKVKVLYQTQAAIADVAGSADATYFAAGPAIWQVESQGRAKVLYVDGRRETIRRLLYVPRAGFFYATDRAVGFAWDGVGLDVVRGARCQIASVGDDLYVYLGNLSDGILRIEGLSRFAARLKPPPPP
jgi:hypothetical protein